MASRCNSFLLRYFGFVILSADLFNREKLSENIIVMEYVEEINGEHRAFLYTGSGAGLTSLARNEISAGNPGEIVVNDIDGKLSSTATLSPAQGGTGIDTTGLTGYIRLNNGTWTVDSQFGTTPLTTALGGTGINTSSSTGIPRIASGTWSVGTISDLDVSPTAAIARGKIATGTPNHVVISDSNGAFSSESALSTVRGGTGTNSSAQSGVAKLLSGTWTFSSIVNGDISSSAAIARNKMAAGTANHVLINDASGVIGSEASLSATRGGTGINSSALSGVAKVMSGVWSASPITNTDISAGAAIARSKLAVAAPGQVVINATDGTLSAEIALAPSRGGTGLDLSGTGVTPYILTAASGSVSNTLGYSVSGGPNTLVQRDSSGGVTLGDTLINGALVLQSNATTYRVMTATITTAGNTTTPIISFTASPGNNGGYGRAVCHLIYASRSGSTLNTGSRTFSFRYAIIGAAMAVSAVNNSVNENDLAFMTTGISVTASGANVVVSVNGASSTNITWNLRLETTTASLV